MSTRALVAICCLFALLGGQTMPVMALDGNGWRKLSEPARTVYVIGVVDAWFSVESEIQGFERDGHERGTVEKILGGTSECLKGKPYGQAAAIVDKYMKDHPEEWHKPMAGIVLVAIVSTCTK